MKKHTREVVELWAKLNGLDITDAAERADTLIQSMLEGTRVGDGNREHVRRYLIDHFKSTTAMGYAAGLAEGERRGRLKLLSRARNIAIDGAIFDINSGLWVNVTRLAARSKRAKRGKR